ncbi:Os06g0554200 [Oryza sativa Japonica Group]|uniref:Os06g0554200 protein n=1 Tax=Oryza sativa subsp. japonica TaxID=39947 RepID=A0A0P0WXZ6_ORYSJ|nr:Os06g0554200 [Oryza sativa Japonica Group]
MAPSREVCAVAMAMAAPFIAMASNMQGVVSVDGNAEKRRRTSSDALQRTVSDVSYELHHHVGAKGTTMVDDAAAAEQKQQLDDIAEVEDARCECCGMSEECTPEYIRGVRARFAGRLVCGLCAEAVAEEAARRGGAGGVEAALRAHTAFRHIAHVSSIAAAAAAPGGDISSRHTGQAAPSSLPDAPAAAAWSSRRRRRRLSSALAAALADHSWWNLSRARGPATTSASAHVGAATSRATWHGRSDCRHTQASSSERPSTRRRTKRMCLHGTDGSGHVHAGAAASVTVYTFPVAPSTKNSGPARCSSRSWCCSARMIRLATRRVTCSSLAAAAADAAVTGSIVSAAL